MGDPNEVIRVWVVVDELNLIKSHHDTEELANKAALNQLVRWDHEVKAWKPSDPDDRRRVVCLTNEAQLEREQSEQ